MATVNKILKPRRGKKSTMAGTKASTVLAAGELFLEVPDTGVGKGKSKIKVGDGSTAYKSLPYALGDTSTDVITYSSNSSTSVATALNNVASGKTLANMIAGLKQAVSLLNTSVTSLNDDCAQLKNSFQDGCSTIAAKITSLGVTTSSTASPTTISNNISTLATNKYNSGYNTGYSAGSAAFKDYKIICLWNSTNSTVERTITAKTKGTVFIFMSNRADGNLTNNVNINQQFAVKQNGYAVSPCLIDDNMTQFNDGAGTRMALAVLNVNVGDSIYLLSNVWAAFTYLNRCYLTVPIDFSYA